MEWWRPVPKWRPHQNGSQPQMAAPVDAGEGPSGSDVSLGQAAGVAGPASQSQRSTWPGEESDFRGTGPLRVLGGGGASSGSGWARPLSRRVSRSSGARALACSRAGIPTGTGNARGEVKMLLGSRGQRAHCGVRAPGFVLDVRPFPASQGFKATPPSSTK